MMFGLTRIAICALFLCADHTVRSLDDTSRVFHDVASADEGSNEPIIGDSMIRAGGASWDYDTGFDNTFNNRYNGKCLGFSDANATAELTDCTDSGAHFAIEKLFASYWKIRWSKYKCVGVTKKKKGRTLSLMDCGEDEDEKIVWVLPDVDEYGGILLANDNDYCVRSTKLSKKCSKKKSEFLHEQIDHADDDNIHIEEIA